MKLAIIAASLFASSAAFAITPSTSGVLVFGMESVANCSLTVQDDKAVLANGKPVDVENFAKATLTSDLSTLAEVTVRSVWTDTTAWGGVVPKAEFRLKVSNTNEGDLDVRSNNMEMNNIVLLKQNQDHSIFLGAGYVDQPTQVGKGEIQSTVQINCQ